MRLIRSGALFAALYAFVVFWLSAFQFSRFRWDFYFLADAFLHGRTWVTYPPSGAVDTISSGGHVFLPFGPLPALLFMPLVAALGVMSLLPWEPTINAALSATAVGLAWSLIARSDGGNVAKRIWITAFFAFSTSLWWVTTRGGPWHTGQIVATIVSLIGLLEATGRRRPWVLGVAAGAGFLARAPLLSAVPFYAWAAVWRDPRSARPPSAGRQVAARIAVVLSPVVVAVVLAAAYNSVRFGSPLESGYGLADLSPPLAASRAHGLFSLAYLPRNLDFLLIHLPAMAPAPLFILPDGFGLSILITSPAILLALWADFRKPLILACATTALAVLLPNLLYYGGGWFQVGFRYFLDSMPFVLVLVASGARGQFGTIWKVLIGFGVLVGLWSVAFAYLSRV